jgi:putative ABC transport system permease protein
MRLPWQALLRHWWRHPLQLLLALAGLAIGVATIAAIDMATASALEAFQLSIDAVNGTATHEIVAGPAGIDESLYVALRRGMGPISLAPIVEGYAEIGDRTVNLVGIDPFANPGFDDSSARRLAPQFDMRLDELSRWFAPGGATLMAAQTAKELDLAPGQSFSLHIAGRRMSARYLAPLARSRAGDESLLVTDIAQAQEWLQLVGRLSRIELRAPSGAAGDAALARLRQRLPAGVEVRAIGSRTRENLDLSAAFTTNLQVMSLLALLVGFFLIYSAVSFAVVQRRQLIGVLRALGATPRDVLAILLGEAAVIGAAGALLGVLLGVFIGHALVELVAGTINDLYFVVAVERVTLPALALLKAFAAGIAVALVAAAVPAIEAAASRPQLGLKRSVLEARATAASRSLLIASALLAAVALAIVLGSSRSLAAGFVALFCLLIAVAALAPGALRVLARAAAHLVGGANPVARLALSDIAASLSRTGVAVAALSLAVCAMIGVALMVDSFRESLRDWLGRTLRADLFVSAPGPGFARPERQIDKDLVAALLAVPGISAHSESRRVRVESNLGEVSLDALALAPRSAPGFQLIAGDASSVWSAYGRGALVISEPLAWRLRLKVGDQLTLHSARGAHAFPIAGIYRDYGNDNGTALLERAVYAAWWHDEALTGLGLYLAPGVPSARIIAALNAAAAGRQGLLVRSNADLRAYSMDVFERTFVITRVLYWLTAGVAALSLVSSLIAWELERARELALLRALGLTPRGMALLIEAQTAFIGLVALLTAIPAGVLTALMLIDVVNRRAFGWQIDLHVHPQAFATALGVALTGALAAGCYPAWRSARAGLALAIREE